MGMFTCRCDGCGVTDRNVGDMTLINWRAKYDSHILIKVEASQYPNSSKVSWSLPENDSRAEIRRLSRCSCHNISSRRINEDLDFGSLESAIQYSTVVS